VSVDIIQGISHLVIKVDDLDAAEAFYRDGLGMTSLGRDMGSEDASHAVLAAGDGKVILVTDADRPDLSSTGVHQAYRISATGRALAAERLGALGFKVETYVEDRAAETGDNFYVFDPAGNRVQLVIQDGEGASNVNGGITGIDHACVQHYDMQWAETFYGAVLDLTRDDVTGFKSSDYFRARDWGDDKIDMAPGCCRLIRYYREVPGQNRMQPRPNMQMYFRAGVSVVGVYLAMEDYAEPPEEQLTGAPRTAFRVRPGGLDRIAPALEAAGQPFIFPAGRGQILCRDTGGNFIEFTE
jgi:catechol 2,3-dioxygenase-like lactoylglutathione lyase family enzyme